MDNGQRADKLQIICGTVCAGGVCVAQCCQQDISKQRQIRKKQKKWT